MSQQPPAARAADAREMPRTNMYMAAVVRFDGGSSAAKIRNMSAWGALLESPALPPEGARVQLVRGSLRADATVAWLLNGRCGIRFDAPVALGEWMSAPANREQSRVDHTFALLRAGAVPISAARKESAPAAPFDKADRLAGELSMLASSVDELGAKLGEDPRVVLGFARQLQDLDLVAQSLDLAAALLMAGGADQPDILPRLQHLRAIRAEAAGRAR